MISFLRAIFTRRILLIAAPLAVCLGLFFPGVASAHAILLQSARAGALFRNSGASLLVDNTSAGQLDAPTFFDFVMITLVNIGAVFWVGAQIWMTFVLSPAGEDHAELREANGRMKQRFERLFSLPTLLVLFLANIGVIVGQALLTGSPTGSALAPSLLVHLATSGRFGTFWMMREVVIVVALILALYSALSKSSSRLTNMVLPWITLLLGLALFMAMTMSGPAAAVNNDIVVYSIVLDWLHLLAAALWVGGMMFIATTYLPILRKQPIVERAGSLVTILPYYLPWALVGVLIMAVTGPFNADFHLTAWNEFFTTAYGRALTVKIVLVGALLLTTAYYAGLLRPRLKKEYKKYVYVAGRLQERLAAAEVQDPSVVGAQVQTSDADGDEGQGMPAINPVPTINRAPAINRGATSSSQATTGEAERATRFISQQAKRREGRVAKGTQRLMQVLRWQPLLGVGVLICVGLMNVFGGTIPAAGAAQQQPSTTPTTQVKPFQATVKTSDNKFLVTLHVNPNRFGANVFTVTVVDSATHKTMTNVGVALYTTMLDMDMGTQNVNLLPDGKGHFSASGDLTMAGNWQIRIQIRTTDHTLHEATVDLNTPF